MAKSPLYDRVTLEEYLALEETATEKHELWRGHVYAMAGGSSNHRDIIVSLTGICRNALRGRPCRFVGENGKVVVDEAGSGYYPDGAIACPPNEIDRRRGTYDNPTVIFEVLSPSTEARDRKWKFDDYRSLPSLKDYVLIDSMSVRVEVFSRLPDDRWVQSIYLPGTKASVPSVGVELSLAELYEYAVFEESPPITGDPS